MLNASDEASTFIERVTPPGDRDAEKRVPMGEAVGLRADLAIACALEAAKPNDVVLICGKSHETEQTVADTRTHLDDDAACVRALCSAER